MDAWLPSSTRCNKKFKGRSKSNAGDLHSRSGAYHSHLVATSGAVEQYTQSCILVHNFSPRGGNSRLFISPDDVFGRVKCDSTASIYLRAIAVRESCVERFSLSPLYSRSTGLMSQIQEVLVQNPSARKSDSPIYRSAIDCCR